MAEDKQIIVPREEQNGTELIADMRITVTRLPDGKFKTELYVDGSLQGRTKMFILGALDYVKYSVLKDYE